jgi:hypothetical protein
MGHISKYGCDGERCLYKKSLMTAFLRHSLFLLILLSLRQKNRNF